MSSHAWSLGTATLLLLCGLSCLITAASAVEQDPFAPVAWLIDLDGNLTTRFATFDPATPVIVEFYASWCPHCRYFAPQFDLAGHAFDGEKLKRIAPGNVTFYTNETGTRDPDRVVLARIDCAKEPGVCGNFKVPFYPYITLGAAKSYAETLLDNLKAFDNRGDREATAVTQWAGELFGLDVSPVIAKVAQLRKSDASHKDAGQPPAQLKAFASLPGPVWDVHDVESATVFLYHTITNDPQLHSGAEKRQALDRLTALWAATHPSDRCRNGSQELSSEFAQWWPEGVDAAPERVLTHQICGSVTRMDDWVLCKGSTPSARGFTCGLWLMWHTCAARLPDPREGGLLLMAALHAFNQNFFQCEVCQKHFSHLLEGADAIEVRTRREALLWLWKAHNLVNLRLAAIEKQYNHSSSGDPAHPKGLFPSAQACPACWRIPEGTPPASPSPLSAEGGEGTQQPDWDLDQVANYLYLNYGSQDKTVQQLLVEDYQEREAAQKRQQALQHQQQQAAVEGVDDARLRNQPEATTGGAGEEAGAVARRFGGFSVRPGFPQQQLSASWVYVTVMLLALLAAVAALVVTTWRRRGMGRSSQQRQRR